MLTVWALIIFTENLHYEPLHFATKETCEIARNAFPTNKTYTVCIEILATPERIKQQIISKEEK